MKTFCYLACALALIAMPSMALAASGPGPYNLLVAIDDTSIKPTADPCIFSLHDARGRHGDIGTLYGNADLSIFHEYQNVCVNPNFYDGSDVGTVPDSWIAYTTVSGDVQYETNENSAVRIAYTALASDVNDIIMLYSSDSVPASPGDYLYLSADTNGSMSGASAFLMIQAYNNGNAIGNKVTYMPVSSLTERLSVSYNLPANTNGIRAFVYIDSIDNGDSVDIRISSVNLNSSGVVRACTGSGESGCYWSGATNNSYSTHPTEAIIIPDSAVSSARAVEFWFRPDYNSVSDPTYRYLLNGDNAFLIYTVEDEFVLDTFASNTTVHHTFNAGDMLHIVARWDTTLTMTVNGVSHSGTTPGTAGDLTNVFLCSETATASQCEGELSAVRFYRSLTEDQATWLYNNGAGRSVAEVENMVEVVEGETGTFMVDPTVSYGQAGNIITGLLSGGLVLFLIVLQVVAWFRQ